MKGSMSMTNTSQMVEAKPNTALKVMQHRLLPAVWLLPFVALFFLFSVSAYVVGVSEQLFGAR